MNFLICAFFYFFFFFSDYWGGWACFTVSIILVGVLTAFIGDFASHFGCTIGLKDAVTAVSFVALGTSVPGKPVFSSLFQYLYNLIVFDYGLHSY